MRPAKLCIGALLRRTMSGPMRGDRVRTEARTLRKLSDCTELAEGSESGGGNNAKDLVLLRSGREKVVIVGSTPYDVAALDAGARRFDLRPVDCLSSQGRHPSQHPASGAPGEGKVDVVMSNESKQLDRSDRGWQKVAAPLKSMLKGAIVGAALSGKISGPDAEKMIRKFRLKDA